ncbi:uncharacterized protein [Physcomitrium patens]|uniref:Uncharacterized protein n=1 Tax=Physcomitrium patens TaxID=3218 RepID=A0A2K1IJW5_PHYPA|nr:uncharacterized protein LOC112275537 [Physcomitrium patens]XP_024361748.1 uncharacterized protein LOC112275537 [Physcomitrium patens]XP_024361749.1 uncharacterized protein LOC112275537 [Physcomitrium patens]XP_024361750.1 uncharacterized protein LOC112275537 [Physcomitrium patens]XP_024361751.1 uncharacterized protein LOC112275537 [Physcomitrium patens]PNR29565.1 hypothetical protein PHYPA_028259 [Physcomitrium patens]|eukprot:XP_024361747.1 uncharacterized protein LOC112275537 [Physcomitrella patens]
MASLNSHQEKFVGSKLHHSSSSYSRASELAASKIIHKRRRASRRTPTTILKTSCQEFREAVQKLTGFHRPTMTTSSKTSQPKIPSYEHDVNPRQVNCEDDTQVPLQVHSSSQSVPSDLTLELPDANFFQQFLRCNMDSTSPGTHEDRSKFDASVPSLRGARFPTFANMPPGMRAVYRQPVPPPVPPDGPFGPSGLPLMPSLWDILGSDFMSSLAKLQDPGLAPNPYLIALENQLLAKFARRMQLPTSNPSDPWYPMDYMPPMRA